MKLTTNAGRGSQAQRGILGLDLIRLLAALLVMSYHLGFWEFRSSTEPFLARTFNSEDIGGMLAPFCDFGWIGVEIFFVISGFVIAYSAEGADAYSFFRSRLARLMPAIWICSTLALAAALIYGDGFTTAAQLWVRSMVLYPDQPWIISAMWTLPIEVSFYAVVLFLILLRKYNRIAQCSTIIGLYSSAYWMLYAFALSNLPSLATTLHAKSQAFYIMLTLTHHGCFFAFGVLMWIIMVNGIYRPFIFFVPILFMGCVFEIVSSNSTIIHYTKTQVPALVPVAAWTASVILLATSIIFNGALRKRYSLWTPTVRWLGLLTYPLYLLHVPIANVVIYFFVMLHANPFLAWSAGILAALVAAALVTSYAEPVIKSLTVRALDKAHFNIAHIISAARGQRLPIP